MTFWHQAGSRGVRVAGGHALPLSLGLGLAIGAVASLGLWAGLAHVAVRLLG